MVLAEHLERNLPRDSHPVPAVRLERNLPMDYHLVLAERLEVRLQVRTDWMVLGEFHLFLEELQGYRRMDPVGRLGDHPEARTVSRLDPVGRLEGRPEVRTVSRPFLAGHQEYHLLENRLDPAVSRLGVHQPNRQNLPENR